MRNRFKTEESVYEYILENDVKYTRAQFCDAGLFIRSLFSKGLLIFDDDVLRVATLEEIIRKKLNKGILKV